MKLRSSVFSPLSSKIDWCEPNYVVTEYIAEFWNTASNVLFLILPPIMMWLHKGYAVHTPHCKFVDIIWLLLIGIGVGSIYFHSTLSLFGQFVDEMGILWVCCAVMCLWMLNCYLPQFWRSHRIQYQCLVLSLGALATILSFLKPEINHFFLFLFVLPSFMILRREMKKSKYDVFKNLCSRAMRTWIVALLCWALDRLCCPIWLKICFPYLHGIWHILTVIGGCQVCVCFAYCYAAEQVPQKQPILKFYNLFNQVGWCGLWFVTFENCEV